MLANIDKRYNANTLNVFIEGLNIKKSDHNLGASSGSHAYQTIATTLRFEKAVLKEMNEVVFIWIGGSVVDGLYEKKVTKFSF